MRKIHGGSGACWYGVEDMADSRAALSALVTGDHDPGFAAMQYEVRECELVCDGCKAAVETARRSLALAASAQGCTPARYNPSLTARAGRR